MIWVGIMVAQVGVLWTLVVLLGILAAVIFQENIQVLRALRELNRKLKGLRDEFATEGVSRGV